MAFGTKDSGSGNFDGYSGSGASSSFFGKTMKIEGEVTSEEDLTIEGKVDGEINVSKTVTIGRDGYVKGKISASVVHISGEAEGHVQASKKLEISSEGKYTGNIQSEIIRVAEGAKLKGGINLQDDTANKDVTPDPVPPKVVTTEAESLEEQEDQMESEEEKENTTDSAEEEKEEKENE